MCLLSGVYVGSCLLLVVDLMPNYVLRIVMQGALYEVCNFQY
jgi:hypothetical protein